MARVTFIVAEPNFIVRKGLVNIINEMSNTRVVGELEGIKNLLGTSTLAQVVVVAETLLSQVTDEEFETLYAKRKNLMLVCVSHQRPEGASPLESTCAEVIYFDDDRETVTAKLRGVQEKLADPSKTVQDQVLSEREVQILKDIALGLSNKEIAEKNFISQHTVITHRKNITNKLGIKTVSGLTIYAMLNKLIAFGDADLTTPE